MPSGCLQVAGRRQPSSSFAGWWHPPYKGQVDIFLRTVYRQVFTCPPRRRLQHVHDGSRTSQVVPWSGSWKMGQSHCCWLSSLRAQGEKIWNRFRIAEFHIFLSQLVFKVYHSQRWSKSSNFPTSAINGHVSRWNFKPGASVLSKTLHLVLKVNRFVTSEW